MMKESFFGGTLNQMVKYPKIKLKINNSSNILIPHNLYAIHSVPLKQITSQMSPAAPVGVSCERIS